MNVWNLMYLFRPPWDTEVDIAPRAIAQAKRIRTNGRTQVVPRDARGRPLQPFIPARGLSSPTPTCSIGSMRP